MIMGNLWDDLEIFSSGPSQTEADQQAAKRALGACGVGIMVLLGPWWVSLFLPRCGFLMGIRSTWR
jgi:hypothetical protein